MSLTDNENPFTNAHIVTIKTDPTDCDLEIVMEEFEEVDVHHFTGRDRSVVKREIVSDDDEEVNNNEGGVMVRGGDEDSEIFVPIQPSLDDDDQLLLDSPARDTASDENESVRVENNLVLENEQNASTESDSELHQENRSNQLKSYKRKSTIESSKAVKKVKHQQVQEIDQEEDEKEVDVKDEETEEIHKFVTLELNCTEPDCKLTFKSLAMWKEHLKTCHGQMPYKHLQDNVRHNQLGQTEHPCTDCKVVHKSQHSLNQHWRLFHLPGKFQCSVCEFVAKLASEIGVHQRKHHVKKFQCTDGGCNRTFRSKQSLEQHKHAYDRPYKCVWANCEEDFKYHSQALAHVRLHHFNKGDTRDPQWYVRRL